MDLEPYLRAAAVVQLAIASANLVAVRLFRYRDSLADVPTAVRQVFWVQNLFIVVTLVGISALCLAVPGEFATTSIGRGLSAFLACFWGLRLAVQLFYYSPSQRREHRALDVSFVIAFVYLTVLFAIAAAGA